MFVLIGSSIPCLPPPRDLQIDEVSSADISLYYRRPRRRPGRTKEKILWIGIDSRYRIGGFSYNSDSRDVHLLDSWIWPAPGRDLGRLMHGKI
jgi:hypothetical protein